MPHPFPPATLPTLPLLCHHWLTLFFFFFSLLKPGLDGNRVGHPRGKMLGGSSAINAMFWTHASQRDINDWGELGNDGWSWDSLLPYFLKSETFVAPSPQTAEDLDTDFKFDPSVHGEHGPVINSFPEFHGSFSEAWPSKWTSLDSVLEIIRRFSKPSPLFRVPKFSHRFLATSILG